MNDEKLMAMFLVNEEIVKRTTELLVKETKISHEEAEEKARKALAPIMATLYEKVARPRTLRRWVNEYWTTPK